MANRMICFGYKMSNGTLCVAEEEATVVTEIFLRYGAGEVMKDIAEDLTRRGVVFSPGKSVWNKPMLARMLENRKYIGENNYPRIVSDAVFERANSLKTKRGKRKGLYSAEVTYLKGILICAQCEHRTYRRPNWRTREKWICPAGCKTDTYVGDMELTQEILKVLMYVKQNPDILTVDGEKTSYHPDMEVMRQTNEIHRLMDQPAVQFQTLKELILQCTDMKFQCCSDN
ncbi:MAG: recombinase family protein, partial [Clostridia bacterium]|nr:recombinase family protein [Clostridia bacterium]